ncbi:hypothetical protein AVEN_244612-1 [Araneus ventricosus]|uniref:Uncharacterized protein n=1 Tax=Araneus ventricosus TaxID=182803 RepID=A0A4Y2IL76_ARAVE|nr:hypothetical protein AVEN_244612-1 [Araneus ventricosus]
MPKEGRDAASVGRQCSEGRVVIEEEKARRLSTIAQRGQGRRRAEETEEQKEIMIIGHGTTWGERQTGERAKGRRTQTDLIHYTTYIVF